VLRSASTCRVGRHFYLFYGGAYNCAPQQIGCAISDDGLHWQRLWDQPFLANGRPGEWNVSESGPPFVFFDPQGRSFLFYQGSLDGGHSWYQSKVQVGWQDGWPCVLAHGASPSDRVYRLDRRGSTCQVARV
jgi:hypothetical protein